MKGILFWRGRKMTKLDCLTLSVSLLAQPFTYFLKLIVHS